MLKPLIAGPSTSRKVTKEFQADTDQVLMRALPVSPIKEGMCEGAFGICRLQQ